MTRTNPADRARDELEALEAAFWTETLGGFLGRLRRIREETLRLAIRSGSVLPITRSREFGAALSAVRDQSSGLFVDLHLRGFRSGLREIPGGSTLWGRLPDLAEEFGAPRALSLVQGVDGDTRETIRRLVSSASRSYANAPSLNRLRALAEEIRPLIGLTPKQAAMMRRRWKTLERAGLSRDAIRQAVDKSSRRLIELRAKAIADRSVLESVSFARHQSWVEAEAAGEISNPFKVWRTQGDDRVRELHAATAALGPIPLNEVYPIQGVMHPPSLDFGCRCWENLVLLDRAPDRSRRGPISRATSTPESRARRAAELRARRREFETRRRELENRALGRRGTRRLESELQSAWVRGSRNKKSIHFQHAVRREFRMSTSVWNRRGHDIDPDLVERFRSPVRSLYNATQKALRKAGIRRVKLYRGIKDGGIPLRGVMESWTTDFDTALKFAGSRGEVMTITVPRERILMWSEGPFWTNGPFGEQFEYVILGE